MHRFWRPSGAGASFTFPAGGILEPLSAHAADLVVCEGVDFVGVDNHEPGMSNMLTGGGTAASVGGGMSVDQYVASQVGGATRFPSLELGVQTSAWGGNRQTRMCYAAPDVFVTPEDNPLSAWKRLASFGTARELLERCTPLRQRRSSDGEMRGCAD